MERFYFFLFFFDHSFMIYHRYCNCLHWWGEKLSIQEVQCLPGLSSRMAEWFKALRCWRACCSFVRLKKWNESQQQYFTVPQFITQSSKIWDRHCAWLASWIPVSLTREALFSLLSRWLPSACSPPCLSGCLFTKAFLYTLPDLINARAKATTNYMKKATAVTADSMMVNSSTLNPVFWGLMLCAWVCYDVLCGLTCLVFCVQSI